MSIYARGKHVINIEITPCGATNGEANISYRISGIAPISIEASTFGIVYIDSIVAS
jgi:hypothetical protein